MANRIKWQQLCIVENVRGELYPDTLDLEIIDEIQEFKPTERFKLDHLGWLGWELVAVCKNKYYYKRPMSV